MSTELPQTGLPVPPLSEARFLESHVAFETSSDQQARIRAFLSSRPPATGARIWSVGCGSGILDAPILEAWAGRGHRFVGLEPNGLQCEALRRRLEPLDIEVETVASSLEDFQSEERFDLIWLVHTHYYFRDPVEGLARVARHLAPKGELILVSAPLGRLNQLASQFWSADADELWFSEAVLAHFDRRGVQAETHRIDGRLDVTSCLRGEPAGDAIRDFVVQADTRAMKPKLRSHIDEALRAMSRSEPDGRITVPHPADVFVLSAETARRLVE